MHSLPGKASASPVDREILRLAVPAFLALVTDPLFLLAEPAIIGDLGGTLVWLWTVFVVAFLGGRGVVLLARERTTSWMTVG